MTPEQQIEKLVADRARRISDLEAALRRIAEEPNIDKARAIADAVLSSKR